jgi:hypothetical protein
MARQYAAAIFELPPHHLDPPFLPVCRLPERALRWFVHPIIIAVAILIATASDWLGYLIS